MFIIFYRTIALYLGVLIVIRIMGKREVGQLSPFDLVVAIMIAETAAISMEDLSKPLIVGFIPILTLMLAEILFSYACLKNNWVRKLITGEPSILIDKGVIMEKEMRKIRYNVNDLLAQLRGKNVSNINDVEYAILEPSGELNVILKADKRPLTPADINLKPSDYGLPLPVIFDGEVQESNLRKLGRDRAWLKKKLAEKGISHFESVLLACSDFNGNMYISSRSKE